MGSFGFAKSSEYSLLMNSDVPRMIVINSCLEEAKEG